MVISEVHSNNDPKKCRDDRHGWFLANSGIQA